jgi:hypothetical protein
LPQIHWLKSVSGNVPLWDLYQYAEFLPSF